MKVNNWNNDLSPWKAEAVFGRGDFEGRGDETLEEVLRETEDQEKEYIIGGYSLAGLFALWASCRTDRFSGVAAASPSVWFPGFTSYMREHMIQAERVYLSLGDREEKTRNRTLSRVGVMVRQCSTLLQKQGVLCTLDWNPGNHFRDPDIRMAKAFAWTLGH
jgi:predicted alpha/beta superfamily hydrolase